MSAEQSRRPTAVDDPTGGQATEERVAEHRESIWWLTASPLFWAAHHLSTYITAAIWCAKEAGADGSATEVRWAVLVYTVVALSAIAWVGWRGYRRHRFGDPELPHDFGSPQDRYRFLGFATLLLSALSFVATTYTALVLVFIGSCY